MYGSFNWSAPRAAAVPDTSHVGGLLLFSFAGMLAARRKRSLA